MRTIRSPRLHFLILLVLIPLATVGAPARLGHAGIITGFSTTGPGLGSALVFLPATSTPNNDDFTGGGNPNVVTYQIIFNAVAPVDFVFGVQNSGGSTEYFFDTALVDTVFNQTGITWTDYHFELGFGAGTSFVRSAPSDGLDFDFPTPNPVPTSTRFTSLTDMEDSISWSGGTVPSSPSFPFFVDLTFAIDVPDGITQFSLRQLPTTTRVPAPTTLLLLGSGLAALAVLVGTRHRRK